MEYLQENKAVMLWQRYVSRKTGPAARSCWNNSAAACKGGEEPGRHSQIRISAGAGYLPPGGSFGHRSVNTTRGCILFSGGKHRTQIETLSPLKISAQCTEKMPNNVGMCSNYRRIAVELRQSAASGLLPYILPLKNFERTESNWKF